MDRKRIEDRMFDAGRPEFGPFDFEGFRKAEKIRERVCPPGLRSGFYGLENQLMTVAYGYGSGVILCIYNERIWN